MFVSDKKIWKEMITFSLIGLSNVGIYLLLVSFFIYLTELNLSFVNGLAYLLSAVYSFCLNTIFTFKQAFNKLKLVKFLTASLFLSLLASVITAIILFFEFQYWISVIVVIFGLPILSFFIHRRWSFGAS
jgi:putative flippase GtrA